MENSENNVNNGGSFKGKAIGIIILIIVLAIAGYFMYKQKGGEAPVESVATVNGVVIPKTEYNTQLANAIELYKAQGTDVTNAEILSQIEKQVLDNLVNNELLNQAVKEAGITATAEEIETQYQATLVQLGGAEGLAAELAKNNLTDAKFRENLAKQIAVQSYLLKNLDLTSVTATDEEVSTFYTEYSKSMKDAGQTVPAMKDISEQIKQQIVSNKQQTLLANLINELRAKAVIVEKATAPATN